MIKIAICIDEGEKEERCLLLTEQLEFEENPVNSGVRQLVIIAYCQAYATYDSSWTCLTLTSCWVCRIQVFKQIRGDLLHFQEHECHWELLHKISCKIINIIRQKPLLHSRKTLKNFFMIWGWWNTGTGCPEKFWMSCHWNCSGPGWMGLWATWCSERCPCSWQGGWSKWSLKVPSNPNHCMISWFFSATYF